MDRAKERSSSRRQPRLCGATFAATDRWLKPGQAFAEARGFISPIKPPSPLTPRVCIKVHALEGSGENAAVLTGTDGKTLPSNRTSHLESIDLSLRRST
jgi:hypothetical protein